MTSAHRHRHRHRHRTAGPVLAVVLVATPVGLGACSGAEDTPGASGPEASSTPTEPTPDAEDLAVRDATRQGRVAADLTRQAGSVDRTLDEVLAESDRRGVALARGSVVVRYSYAEPRDVSRSSFRLCVENGSEPDAGVAYAVYDSRRAEVVERGATGGCLPGP